MTTAAATRFSWSDVECERVSPSLDRQLITGDRAMLARVTLAKGAVVPKHQHVHEQFAVVLEGALLFKLGEDERETIRVSAGQVLHLPSNVWHAADVLEATVVLDVFSPPREDWLQKQDTYLRAGATK